MESSQVARGRKLQAIGQGRQESGHNADYAG